MQLVSLTCDFCRGDFKRKRGAHEYNLRRGGRGSFCSKKCHGNARKLLTLVKCEECGKTVEKPARDAGRFCSQGCANRHIGRVKVARSLNQGRLCECGNRLRSRSECCKSCRSRATRLANNAKTLQEVREECGSSFEFHAKLRGWSRLAYEGPKSCYACGYDLHVDIAHIRPVSDFPTSALVSEVNDPSNLVALDKRCHWEFDHGYLQLNLSGVEQSGSSPGS